MQIPILLPSWSADLMWKLYYHPIGWEVRVIRIFVSKLYQIMAGSGLPVTP